MVPKTREDVYQIKKGDEIRVGGMLYKAMDSFDKHNNQVLVCCYKDYPTGGFDEANPYFIKAESIFQKLNIHSEIETKDYFVEKLKKYSETVEVLPPPCEMDKMDELFVFFRRRYSKKDFFIKDALKTYTDIDINDLMIIADYFGDVVSPYMGEICTTYASIHGEKHISESEKGQRDKDRVIDICKTTFTWITEETIISILDTICYYANL